MATSDLVGYGPCLVCGHASCRYGLTVKGHICAVCNACNVQVFGRSETSDLRLKAMVRGTDKPAEPPATTPAPPAPAAPAPSPAPAPTEKPRRRGFLEGVFD